MTSGPVRPLPSTSRRGEGDQGLPSREEGSQRSLKGNRGCDVAEPMAPSASKDLGPGARGAEPKREHI